MILLENVTIHSYELILKIRLYIMFNFFRNTLYLSIKDSYHLFIYLSRY